MSTTPENPVPVHGGAPPSRTDRFAQKLAELVTSFPRTVVALTVALVLAATSGALFLDFSNNYRAYFSAENPDLVAFESFQATYTKNDNILFVLRPAEGDVFAGPALEAVEWLTAEAWQIPYALRVDSVTNFQHTSADGDQLFVEDLVRDAASLGPDERAERREIALAEPLLRGNLLAEDARTTGVNVTLQYPEKSLKEVPEAAAFARGLAAQVEARWPDVEVALTGVSMLNATFADAALEDARTLVPLMFLVLVVFLFVVLRSVPGTVATLGVIGMSAATALGLAGWVHLELTSISIIAPVIILTLAIADSVHLLSTVLTAMRDGRSKVDAMREALRLNFMAVVITSVTTIVGFLSLNFSDSPPFHHLGNVTAVGIFAALVYSVTFLPAVGVLLPLEARESRTSARSERWLAALADWVIGHSRPILVATGLAAAALIALVPRIELNDEWVKYFDHRVPFRNDAEFAMEHLGGIYQVEYSLQAAGPGGINEPAYLEELQRFTDWLRAQPGVTHVYSYSDVLRRLNKNLHGDAAVYFRLPADRELAAQYLLLYELSLPYGLDLNDRIAVDKSATRLTATVAEISTAEVRRLTERADAWLASALPAAASGQATGATVMFSHISERNIHSMLLGNAFALVLIALVMMLALRSVRIGLLSLVPNAVPILMTFGVWALLVRQVGMAGATVSATSLGIVVDDTVHLLAKFLRARRELGLDRPDAIRYAFRTVGRAVVGTTVVLALGFAALSLSTFRINAHMGQLTAIAIVMALPVDLLFLPSLLMIGHRRRNPERKEPMVESWTRKTLVPKTAVISLLALGLALTPVYASTPAPTPEAKGYEIAALSDRSDRGFGDSVAHLEMVLRNQAGKETTRELTLRTLEMPDESVGDKSLIVFESPADIDGTALLSHARILEPDDQWLYLPALKRVKRISSVNKSGPFVGSEFAFEDLTSLELEKYAYRWLGEEACADLTCDLVEGTPRYEYSGYTRLVAFIDQKIHQVRRIDYYDRRGELLKTLTMDDYRMYGDGWWRAHLLRMVNHKTGKSTDLRYSEFTFRVGLGEDDFVSNALTRLR